MHRLARVSTRHTAASAHVGAADAPAPVAPVTAPVTAAVSPVTAAVSPVSCGGNCHLDVGLGVAGALWAIANFSLPVSILWGGGYMAGNYVVNKIFCKPGA